MKAVILAGGFGTRLSEETDMKPKPMVEVGGKPILWHIMKIYAAAGITEFIICCGYKADYIKKYFIDFKTINSDIEVNLKTGQVTKLTPPSEEWKVTLIDTGLNTMTGGRIKRIKEFVKNETFCLTYGDGVADIDIQEVIKFHKKNGKKATVTAVQSPGRFGILKINAQKQVEDFYEKPVNEMGWINGGFFVLEPSAIDYINGDQTIWEREPLENLAKDNELGAYELTNYWRPMDSLRDKRELDDLWNSGKAPWKKW
jgi:glucose-1-phosphate cytidylyltransferase